MERCEKTQTSRPTMPKWPIPASGRLRMCAGTFLTRLTVCSRRTRPNPAHVFARHFGGKRGIPFPAIDTDFGHDDHLPAHEANVRIAGKAYPHVGRVRSGHREPHAL